MKAKNTYNYEEILYFKESKDLESIQSIKLVDIPLNANKDIPKAVNYCSDIVESLVGEVGNREAIWVNGEKSVIKSGIMSVLLGNKEHKEYQNLPNIVHFKQAEYSRKECRRNKPNRHKLLCEYLNSNRDGDNTYPQPHQILHIVYPLPNIF